MRQLVPGQRAGYLLPPHGQEEPLVVVEPAAGQDNLPVLTDQA
jgi:hypothetical protein